MSQPSARSMPAPGAAPSTAAITGRPYPDRQQPWSRSGATLSSEWVARRAALESFMALTSPPAQKPLPAPVTTSRPYRSTRRRTAS